MYSIKKEPFTNMKTPEKRNCKVPVNMISNEKLVWIKNHINSFPKYVSHYDDDSVVEINLIKKECFHYHILTLARYII